MNEKKRILKHVQADFNKMKAQLIRFIYMQKWADNYLEPNSTYLEKPSCMHAFKKYHAGVTKRVDRILEIMKDIDSKFVERAEKETKSQIEIHIKKHNQEVMKKYKKMNRNN